MKTGFGKIVVRMALVAYLAASSLGTGLHALVHDHHEHLSQASSDSIAGASGTALAPGDEHADDADEACPVCAFQRLVQLPASVGRTPQATAVAEAPAVQHEAPQFPHISLPYSPRGPPDRAAKCA